MTPRFVERPDSARHIQHAALYRALEATMQNGKAIAIPRTETVRSLRSALEQFCRRRGYQFHAKLTKDSLLAWCEKKGAP